jgi:cytochrome c-type biogenesis protein CcmH
MPAARAFFILFVLVALAVLVAPQTSPAHAQTPEPASADTAPSEAVFSESEAQGIDRMIMCPVCPAETIDQAQVQIALQMRAVVREMLGEGKDREEILDFFVERYGQDILGAPPKSGAALVAWLMPAGGVLAAIVAVFFIIRSMTRQAPVMATPRLVPDPGLIPYLQLVDRHLDMTRGGPRPGGTSDPPGPAVESSGTEASDQTGPAGTDEKI